MENDPTWCGADLDGAAARFLARVAVGGSTDCWPWLGAKTGSGHGMAKVAGARQQTTAHRVAYMLTTGRPIPRGMVVRHSCDNPPCCNPAHLLLGTHRDNVQDAVERGRTRNGDTGPLPGNASTVSPARRRLPRPTAAQRKLLDLPPVDVVALAAQEERRALYGA